MSIASEIQALQQDKSDIATAISNKGVTVPSGSGFDSFANLISNIPTGGNYPYIEIAEYTPSVDTKTFSVNYPKTLTGWTDKPMFIYCFAEEVPQRSDVECVIDFGMLAGFGGAKSYLTGIVETRKTNGAWEWYTAERNNRLLLTFDWSTGIINVDTSNQSIFTFAAGIKYKFYFIESVAI